MQSWYQKVAPLNREAHAHLSFQPGTGFGVAGREVALPLALEEVALAAAFYPVVFSAGDQPLPLAVTGLRQGQNLFLETDGAWSKGSYVPAVVRNYPFAVVDAGGGRDIVAIDVEAPQFDALGGQPLFQDGEPTPACRERISLSFAYREGMKASQAFAKALLDAGLLQPQNADIALPGGAERLRVEGFLNVDPKKLEALSDETFLEWRRRGWLPAIYQHLASSIHWPRLMTLAGAHPRAAAEPLPSEALAADAAGAETPDAGPTHEPAAG